MRSIFKTPFAIVTLMLGSLANAQPHQSPDANLQASLLKLARQQMQKGLYREAEAICKQADGLYLGTPAGGSSKAHSLLGEVYIHEDRFEDAVKALSFAWRRGRGVRDDLLVAIAVSLSHGKKATENAVAALVSAEKQMPDLANTVGDPALFPKGKFESDRGARALMLYATSSEISPEESLDLCKKATALVPENPVGAYLLGRAYSKVGQYDLAATKLDFAAAHGSERLKIAAAEAKKLNGATQDKRLEP